MKLWPTNLKQRIRAAVYLLSVILLLLSGFTFYSAWQDYRQAQEMEEYTQTMSGFTKAIRALTVERYRMHLALMADSVSQTDEDVIAKQRLLADASLLPAIARLAKTRPDLAVNLEDGYARLYLLRNLAIAQARLPYGEREAGFTLHWLKNLSEYIFQIESSLRLLGKEQVAPGRSQSYHLLALDGVRFRIFAGYHTAITINGLVRPESGYLKSPDILFLRSLVDHLWSDIAAQAEYLNNQNIAMAKDVVYRRYYREYRPELELTIGVARSSAVPPHKLEQLDIMSLAALESAFSLIDVTEQESRLYVDALRLQANQLFGAAIVQLGFCLLLTMLFIDFLNRRLFRPLQTIVFAIQQICRGEAATLPSEPMVNDEIGQLTQGVQLLQFSMAEERRLKAENERLALTDFLTGCLNKRAFYIQAEAELSRAARDNTPVAFLFADLDNLKQINDTYGHLVGDEAIKHFALSVTGQCRPYDLIGRFGGDEFVFCFPRTTEEQALAIVGRIQEILAQNALPVGEDQQAVSLCSSFGISVKSDDEAHDIEWYIKQADMALYKAKQLGKNCVMSGVQLADDSAEDTAGNTCEDGA